MGGSSEGFAARIRERRLKLGLSQQAAAERSGLSVEGYARIERGVRAPSLETFTKVCRGLGVAPNDALEWGGSGAGEGADVEGMRGELVRRLGELDEDGVRVVWGVVEFAWLRQKGGLRESP